VIGITSRKELIDAIGRYSSSYSDEMIFRDQFLELLQSPRCFHRDHLPGHITGSAFIIDESTSFALLTHHAKLNKWLQPGGHADGDENIPEVALREAEEETGLKNFSLVQTAIFDMDIHTIPARKDFPEHRHYDIRFLLQASRNEKVTITEESHDLAWISLDEIASKTANDSLSRMVEKVRLLFFPPTCNRK
jgi:8-oxo-dGTP pyrophosphatase MutT (NUDIX family)